jgi:hypothetical protein
LAREQASHQAEGLAAQTRDLRAVGLMSHPDGAAYWLFTKTDLNNPATTLHREGCPILRHSQRRTRGVLTGPMTWAQVAALPDEGYQACGRCKPAASSAPAH